MNEMDANAGERLEQRATEDEPQKIQSSQPSEADATERQRQRQREEQERQRRMRDEVAVRNGQWLFEVYREQVQAGEYARQRAALSDHIIDALFFLFFDGFVIAWLLYFQPAAPTRPLFVAERMWLLLWTLVQSLSFFALLFASVLAYYKPRVLLNDRWQKKVFDVHNSLFFAQFLIFLTVVFVDLFEPYLKICKLAEIFQQHGTLGSVTIKSYRPKATQHENLLNSVVRLCQVIASLFIFGAIMVYLEQRNRVQKRRSKADALLKKMSRVKELKWSENQIAGDDLVSEQHDCAFCIVAFEPKDSLVQLKCHKNHIFHRSCFESYLKHLRDDPVGQQPKCPFCKKSIEFQERQ